MATIVILGAGVGGVVAAHRLRHELGREHRIILVDKKSLHTFAPSYLWLMMGWRNPASISRDLTRLSRKGIEFINAQVEGIDLENKMVRTSTDEISYAYLIVALGAELAPEAVPGLSGAYHTVYELEGAARLQQELQDFDGGRVAVVISSLPFKCPPAPYETALLMDYSFRKRGIRNRVELEIFTPEPLPMPVMGPEVGNQVKGILERREIAYHPGLRLSSVDGESRELAFEGDRKERYDLLVAVPPHRCPEIVKDSGLTEGSPWVRVDMHTLETKHPGVYALGDVTMIPLPNGMMLPKAGVFAHGEAETVARNVAAIVQGKENKHRFHGDGYWFLELGHGVAAFARGQFYSEPAPEVTMRSPSRYLHWGKILFEKWWLWRWF